MNAYDICLVIVGFITGILMFYKKKVMDEIQEPEKKEGIKVSVIIPARNEEKNLPGILGDLSNQSYGIHEVICVDDGSTDSTARVIDSFGFTRITIEDLEEGWKGKTWACQKGAEAASGDLLLFVDADVRFSPHAAGKLLECHARDKTPLSVQPYHNVKRFHEYLSMVFNFIQIAATGMCLPFGFKGLGFYGPVFMIEKEIFDEYGGYESVRNETVEDFTLGRHYNDMGIHVDLYMGFRDITFRMYPGGWADVIEGWSKNFSKGAILTSRRIFAMVFVWVSYLTVLPYYIAVSTSWRSFAFAMFFYLLTVLFMYSKGKLIGSYPIGCYIFYPVYMLFFHMIFVYSILATFVFRTTTWKGRRL